MKSNTNQAAGHLKYNAVQWWIQELPEGRPPLRSDNLLFDQFFSENRLKMKKFCPLGRVPSALRSVAAVCDEKYFKGKTILVQGFIWPMGCLLHRTP